MLKINPFFKARINQITIIIIVIITIMGFGSKFYAGPFHSWVNNSLGGFFYVIFWSLLVFIIFKNPIQISLLVFIVTTFLEFMQLWHPPILEKIRSTFIGRTLIGNSFVWTDIIYYFIGCLLAFILLNWLKNKYKPKHE